jgi:predicted enzyme related to lactoylglutathione lyase
MPWPVQIETAAIRTPGGEIRYEPREEYLMDFRISSNVAVRTDHYADAVAFYTGVLGIENRSDDPEITNLAASPFTMFVIEDPEIQGLVMELCVDDLEQAREELVANGCKVLRWRGKGQDCYVKDPFGVIFNLWQE